MSDEHGANGQPASGVPAMTDEQQNSPQEQTIDLTDPEQLKDKV